MKQLELFKRESVKINHPVRLIELFAGVGSQAMALRDIGADFEHWKVVEFDKYAVASYNAIHGTNFEPTDIRNIKGQDLQIVDTDLHTYILTYSFPCQDLSLSGKQRGMIKGSGTRSGLLWEVERLLNETENLPQVLLMENVPQVHGAKNIDDFNSWIDFLKSKGYSNFWQDLNAKDYGVAQNRVRCFMISILGGGFYEFPETVKLEKCIKDYLEEEVEEKYYIKSEKAFKLILDLQERGILEGKEKLVCDLTINKPKEREIMNTIMSRQDRGISNIKAIGGAVVEKVQANIALQKDNIKQATKQGYIECKAGGGDVSPTLTSSNLGVCKVESRYRIRKLTPKECWRFMGFSDEDFDKASAVNSNTQLYKQAGNSIVKDVLMAIFRQML